MKIDQDFIPYIYDYNTHSLNNSAAVIYAIDSNYKIRFFNDAWEHFAETNNGCKIATEWGIGANVINAIEGAQKEFYRELYDASINENLIISHQYECSSSTRYRKFKLIGYPLVNQRGLLLENYLISEANIAYNEPPLIVDDYQDNYGIIKQCGHCRKIYNHRQHTWEWCPSLIDQITLKISHSLCTECLPLYSVGIRNCLLSPSSL